MTRKVTMSQHATRSNHRVVLTAAGLIFLVTVISVSKPNTSASDAAREPILLQSFEVESTIIKPTKTSTATVVNSDAATTTSSSSLNMQTSQKDPDACEKLPFPAEKLTNDEFSICIRIKHNLVDEYMKRNQGYWHDCQKIFNLMQLPPVSKGKHLNVFDIGANIGSCSIWVASRGHFVTSFEPKPEHLQLLKASASLNKTIHDRITVMPFALSDHKGTGELVGDAQNTGNSWLFSSNSSHKNSRRHKISDKYDYTISSDDSIQLLRLDDVCEGDEKCSNIDLMKIDVQGAEFQVLKGAENILKQGKVKKIAFEFWPYALRGHGSHPAELLKFLMDMGFSVFANDWQEIRETDIEFFISRFSVVEDSQTDLTAIYNSKLVSY